MFESCEGGGGGRGGAGGISMFGKLITEIYLIVI